jgi:hypothetical protein
MTKKEEKKTKKKKEKKKKKKKKKKHSQPRECTTLNNDPAIEPSALACACAGRTGDGMTPFAADTCPFENT